MGREEQIINERKRKLKQLIEKGINPYVYKFEQKDFSINIKEKNKKLKNNQRSSKKVQIAGRVMTVRNIGKLIFAHLQDSKGQIQLVLQKNVTKNNSFELFVKYIDIGDIIGVNGKVMKTKTGEISVLADKIELLTKSLLPLPEKWHGLINKEERYRKRYLDLIINPEVRELFIKRAKILDIMRKFMAKHDFIEIETPLLQSVYGGAHAKPFKTYCEAYNSHLYLSIAPELYLKKALVGGLGNVYEITKKFRNEGADRQHNPEHITIEWYQAYADYNDGMKLFEQLIKEIAKELFGKLVFNYQGHKIDLKKWKKISLLNAIKKYLKEDISKVKTDEKAKEIAKKHGIVDKVITKNNLADELLKIFREKLIQPTFLIDYPIELAPLAKPKRGDKTKAEIFQPFIGGMELGRAFSELNDPRLQEENFKEQEKERKIGNKEAMPTDKDFVEALKYSMPPACGVGIGIDRLIMLFTNQPSIRDVILFPFMKPD